MRSAVLYIVFARPDLAARSFEAIRQARPPRLYLAADGPREGRPDDEVACRLTRDTVEAAIDWPCEVHRLLRDKNAGVKINVSEAISWFFEHERQGVIVEDDVLTSLDFFKFCDEMLDRYAACKKVGVICGMSYVRRPMETSYYISQFPDMWGWATWADRWAENELDMRSWPEFRARGGLSNLLGATRLVVNYWCRILDRTYTGAISTWDYQWILTRWRHETVSIHPSRPLVFNIGYGPGATNTPSTKVPTFCRPIERLSWPLQHPAKLELDKRTERRIWRWRFGITAISRVAYYLKAPGRLFLKKFASWRMAS